METNAGKLTSEQKVRINKKLKVKNILNQKSCPHSIKKRWMMKNGTD